MLRWPTKKDKRSTLEKAIDDLAERMKVLGPDDPLYHTYATHMVELQKAKSCEKPRAKLDPNTIVTAAVYLVGVAAVLYFESSDHMITHKNSFGMASKWRLP